MPSLFGCGYAALYNTSAGKHRGQTQAVYANKGKKDCEDGTCVLDLERGIVDRIWPHPWQTDTCIGTWHYNKEAKYKSPKLVIDMLVDIVSRNGNLLLNFPLPSSGMLDPEELKILFEITQWMAVNGEAIYGTRPWKIFGVGAPETSAPDRSPNDHHQAGAFNENKRRTLTAGDLRFTTKGNTLYAFAMGWPQKEALLAPLGTNGNQGLGKVGNVQLLGHGDRLQWKQDAASLNIQMPPEKPCDHAVVFKITTA